MTPAVKWLLYANIGAYIVSLFFPIILLWFGLIPQFVIERRFLWQPVTYMFLHAPGPTHILFNMLILWMFGVELERMPRYGEIPLAVPGRGFEQVNWQV